MLKPTIIINETMHHQLSHSHLLSPVHPRGGENTSTYSSPFDVSVSNDLSSIQNLFDDSDSLLSSSFKDDIIKINEHDNSDTKSVRASNHIKLRESYYWPNKLTKHRVKKHRRNTVKFKQRLYSCEYWPWQGSRSAHSETLDKWGGKVNYFWKGTNLAYLFVFTRILVETKEQSTDEVVLTKVEDLSNKRVMPRACF